MFVQENGDVYPCCHSWRSAPVGSLHCESLETVWNNAGMQAIRRAHLNGDLSDFPECMRCRVGMPVLPVVIGGFLVGMHHVWAVASFLERMARTYRLPVFRKPC